MVRRSVTRFWSSRISAQTIPAPRRYPHPRATGLLHPAINSPPSEVKNSSRFGTDLDFPLALPLGPLEPNLPLVSPLFAVPLLYDSQRRRRVPESIQSSSTFQRPAAR